MRSNTLTRVSNNPGAVQLSKEFEYFWGGYRLEFKLIHSHIFEQLSGDIEILQKQAMSLTGLTPVSWRVKHLGFQGVRCCLLS